MVTREAKLEEALREIADFETSAYPVDDLLAIQEIAAKALSGRYTESDSTLEEAARRTIENARPIQEGSILQLALADPAVTTRGWMVSTATIEALKAAIKPTLGSGSIGTSA